MKQIDIKFDRRTEILSILFWLSNYKTNFSFIVNTEEKSLYSKAMVYFKDTSYHRVVSLFEALVDDYDMNFDAPVALFLQFDENMTSYHLEEYPYVSRLNKNPIVIELMDEVIKFYKESNFEAFYQSNQDYYIEILNRDKSLHLNQVTAVMNELYGNNQDKVEFSINIVSGTTNGGYCVTVGNKVICSSGLYDGSTYLYDSFVLHEFSHHFINPLTDKCLNSNDKNNPLLFRDIMEVVIKQGYGSNDIIINEYIIRGIECCYYDLYFKDDLATFIEKNINQGFKDIEFVYRLLKKEVFDNKKMIQDIYPTLLKTFIEYLKNKLN